MKKLLVSVLAVCVALCLMGDRANAESSRIKDLTPHHYGIGVNISMTEDNNGAVSIQALGECKGGPHQMKSQGWGSIYDVNKKKEIVSFGCCAQCKNCNLVIVTEGEPGTNQALGYYTTWQPNEKLTSFMTVIHQSTSNIHHTSGKTIAGIKFVN